MKNYLISCLRGGIRAHSKVLSNGIWMYVMQFFNTVIPLLTIPYITRILGKTEYGVFSIALNVIGYLQVLIEYGFIMSASRKVATYNEEHIEINSIFNNVIYSRLFLFSISLFVSAIYTFIYSDDEKLCACIYILCLGLLGYVVQQNWLFQGKQDMRYISLINIIGRSISTLLIFFLVKTHYDILLYSLLYSISPFLSGFIGLIISFRKYGLRFLTPDFRGILNELKQGFYVFTTSLSAKVFGTIGIAFLGLLSTKDIVGAFSAIQKIPSIILLAWAPISQLIYPIISKKMYKSKYEGYLFVMKLRKRILSIFIVLSLIFALFSTQIVEIFLGAEYSIESIWLIPLLGWVLFGINNNFLGIQLLLTSGHDSLYSKCFHISVLFTITVNYILISIFDGLGAAIAPFISELFLSTILIFNIKKILCFRISG